MTTALLRVTIRCAAAHTLETGASNERATWPVKPAGWGRRRGCHPACSQHAALTDLSVFSLFLSPGEPLAQRGDLRSGEWSRSVCGFTDPLRACALAGLPWVPCFLMELTISTDDCVIVNDSVTGIKAKHPSSHLSPADWRHHPGNGSWLLCPSVSSSVKRFL